MRYRRHGAWHTQSMFMAMLIALVVPYAAGGLPPFALGMQGVEVSGGVATKGKGKRKRSSDGDTRAHTKSVLSLLKEGVDVVVKIEQNIEFADLPQSDENKEKRKQRILGILKRLETAGTVEKNGKSGHSTRWKLSTEKYSCTSKLAYVRLSNACVLYGEPALTIIISSQPFQVRLVRRNLMDYA